MHVRLLLGALQGGWTWSTIIPPDGVLCMQATAACLTAIVVTQVANVFVCLSSKESVFTLGFFTNKLIFTGIAFEILLQTFIVYHPFGNKIFATRPISISNWVVLIPFALSLIFFDELRKLFLKKPMASGKASPL